LEYFPDRFLPIPRFARETFPGGVIMCDPLLRMPSDAHYVPMLVVMAAATDPLKNHPYDMYCPSMSKKMPVSVAPPSRERVRYEQTWNGSEAMEL